jgi:hypothetical protein
MREDAEFRSWNAYAVRGRNSGSTVVESVPFGAGEEVNRMLGETNRKADFVTRRIFARGRRLRSLAAAG